MMIKINQSVLEERDNDLYETVRSAWKVNLNKAKQYKYCLNCISKNQKKRIVSDPLRLLTNGHFQNEDVRFSLILPVLE